VISPTLYSSASVEWETPQDLFDALNSTYAFTLDVCATLENAKCERFLTKAADGLSRSWSGERVWCNPPYGRGIGHWVERCSKATSDSLHRFTSPPTLAVMLLPARTDTAWWHDYVIPYGRVDFIRGRLKFGGHKNSAPFPSAVVVFGAP
jgi:phage N-6-adenine-methyltransferase